MLKLLTPALAALALLAPAVRAATPAEEVAAAERAFAADALERGVGPSFVTWAAPDGIVLEPDPANAREVYARRPVKPDAPKLRWWPVHAAAARSGDLAFDTGPWVYGENEAHGWFFTVWKRQADGSWKWVLDHGYDGATTFAKDAQVSYAGSGAPGPSAFSQVQGAEATLANAMAQGRVAKAYADRLSPDAWIGGLEPGPVSSSAGIAGALARRPQAIETEPLGGGASRAGDLAYTFGKARWVADGKPVEARYVRVWRREGRAWRILFDMITPN